MNASAARPLSPQQLESQPTSGTPPLRLEVREFPEFAVFAAITDSCVMGMLLKKLPWNRRTAAPCTVTETRA